MGAERNTEPDESLSEHSSGNIEGLIANQSLLEDYLSREHLTAQIADLDRSRRTYTEYLNDLKSTHGVGSQVQRLILLMRGKSMRLM